MKHKTLIILVCLFKIAFNLFVCCNTSKNTDIATLFPMLCLITSFAKVFVFATIIYFRISKKGNYLSILKTAQILEILAMIPRMVVSYNDPSILMFNSYYDIWRELAIAVYTITILELEKMHLKQINEDIIRMNR